MRFVFDPQFGVSQFAVSVMSAGSIATVAVSGELDLATAPKLARVLEGLPDGLVDVQVSLRDVWFADHTAMVRLLRSQSRLSAQGRSMTIVDASDDALRGMRASGRFAEFAIADPPSPSLAP